MGLFDNAESPENKEWTVLPKGDYICRIDNMTLDLAGKFGDTFQLELVVATGDHTKRKVWQTWYLSGDYAARSLGFLKKTMEDCGLETNLDSVEQLVTKWDKLRGKLVETFITQKERKDGSMKNIAYVNKVFTGSITDSGVPNHAPQMDKGDELPF